MGTSTMALSSHAPLIMAAPEQAAVVAHAAAAQVAVSDAGGLGVANIREPDLLDQILCELEGLGGPKGVLGAARGEKRGESGPLCCLQAWMGMHLSVGHGACKLQRPEVQQSPPCTPPPPRCRSSAAPPPPHRRRSTPMGVIFLSFCCRSSAGDHRSVSGLFAAFEAAAAARHEHAMQMHAAAIVQLVRMHSQVRGAPWPDSGWVLGHAQNQISACTVRRQLPSSPAPP